MFMKQGPVWVMTKGSCENKRNLLGNEQSFFVDKSFSSLSGELFL